MLKRVLRFAAIYLIVSVIAAVALLINTWPLHPHSIPHWALLFVIALPITLLGEWLSDRALHSSLSLAVEARTRNSRFSWLRVGYILALCILFAICAVIILYWLYSPD
jgi:hypothetical protein